MIELCNVVKKFGSCTAVNGLSFSVPAGEFFGFLGPNGAGKTTTIKMLTGLFAPTSGCCKVGGFDLQKDPLPAKRLMSYVPDSPFLYEKLTGREFLYFLGGLHGMEKADITAALDGITAEFEIEEYLDRRAEEYSQGMRQRVVLAGALLHKPKVLIIDEPLIGLDPGSSRRVKNLLKRKSGEGMTIFMSTHLLDIVEELCDRCMIIDHGKIIYETSGRPGSNEGRSLEDLFIALTR